MALNVLIADDEPLARRRLASLLSTHADVSIVAQCATGVVLNEQKVNLILSDWNMPNMDGLAFVQAVRANEAWNHIQIIMITTEGGEAKVQEAVAAGANGYVKKPFTADDLEAELTSATA